MRGCNKKKKAKYIVIVFFVDWRCKKWQEKD